jgi:hypothetical protein
MDSGFNPFNVFFISHLWLEEFYFNSRIFVQTLLQLDFIPGLQTLQHDFIPGLLLILLILLLQLDFIPGLLLWRWLLLILLLLLLWWWLLLFLGGDILSSIVAFIQIELFILYISNF